MTRTEAVQFARDMWPLFKTMKRDQWREHLATVARSSQCNEQWISAATSYLEAAFSIQRK